MPLDKDVIRITGQLILFLKQTLKNGRKNALIIVLDNFEEIYCSS